MASARNQGVIPNKNTEEHFGIVPDPEREFRLALDRRPVTGWCTLRGGRTARAGTQRLQHDPTRGAF
jgi:hypothetical protein